MERIKQNKIQPGFTAGKLRLEEVAADCGIDRVRVISKAVDMDGTITDFIHRKNGPHVIVIRTSQEIQENLQVIDLGPLEIRDRFRTHIAR